MDLKATLVEVDEVAAKYKRKPDRVRWIGWKEDETEVSKDWSYTACYSPGMSILPTLKIHCIPHDGPKESQMPALWYHHFFSLLKEHGVVPPGVKTLHRNGAHCLIIPREGWDRHTLYMTLCYYRTCDLKPDEAMRMMLLYTRLAPLGTTFLQCLHYGAATTSFASGHYFINFGAYGGAPALSLANGLALAWYAQQSKEARLKICPSPAGNGCTNTYLAGQAKKMKGVIVEDLSEILNPEHAPLYKEPEENGD